MNPTAIRWFLLISALTIAFLAWVLPFMASLRASASAQDGLPLYRKMQEALGGADRIATTRDVEQLTVAESFNGNTGQSIGEVRKRTRWIRPNYLRVDQVGRGSTDVLYFDGTNGWEILPGRTPRRRSTAV